MTKLSYIDTPYDPEAPDQERIAWLESCVKDLQIEERYLDNALCRLDELAAEISTSVPCAPTARAGRPATLATYWRWVMWMDCMADTPTRLELLMQGLCGAQFELGRVA